MSSAVNPTSVLHKSIQGGKWFTIGNLIQRGISFLSFFILARLLSPSDFGTAAIVLLVPNLLHVTTETGLVSAVIQKGGDSTKYWDPLWTLGILRSLGIVIVTFFLGPTIARLLHAEYATHAIQLGGVLIFLYNLSNIGENYFVKDLDIKRLVIRNMCREISYSVTAIIAVLIYPSFWSLLFATAVSYVCHVLATYALHPYRPRLSFQFGRLRDLFGYSKWMVGQVWLDQLMSFAEPSIVAHTTTPTAMGLYSKGKNVASIAPGFIGPMISLVSFAAFSKIKEQPDKIREGFKKSLDIIFFSLIPTTLLFLCVGGTLVQFALGSIWLGIVPVLKIFIVFFLFSSMIDLGYTLLNAMGYPHRRVRLDAIKIVLTLLLLIYLTPRYGITGAAFALLISILPTYLLMVVDLRRLAGIGIKDIARRVFIPLSVSVVIGVPVLVWRDAFIALPLFPFLSLIILMAALYCLVVSLIGKYFHHGPYPTLRLILTHLHILP